MILKKKKEIIPPKDGWKESTHYIVDVSYSSGNPVHRSIFYTGFLQDGRPCGYNVIFNPTSDLSHIGEVHYMKAIREIEVEGDFEIVNGQAYEC